MSTEETDIRLLLMSTEVTDKCLLLMSTEVTDKCLLLMSTEVTDKCLLHMSTEVTDKCLLHMSTEETDIRLLLMSTEVADKCLLHMSTEETDIRLLLMSTEVTDKCLLLMSTEVTDKCLLHMSTEETDIRLLLMSTEVTDKCLLLMSTEVTDKCLLHMSTEETDIRDQVDTNEDYIEQGRQLILDFYNNYTSSSSPLTNPVDLVFVLDRSASVTRSGWQSMVRFVHGFLEHFTVDADNTRVAVITYGTTASIDVDGVRAGNYNKCALVARLQRHLAKKVQLRSLVWDTDWDVYTKGPQLQIYAFGIKDAYMPEVRTIATPLPNHTFYIPSFQAFSELARSLHDDSQSENWQVLGDTGYCSQVSECSDNAYCACGTRSGLYVCVCKDGYQGDGAHCTACPRGTYKSNISPLRCHSCPANSTTLAEGATDSMQCVCEPPMYQEASGRPCHVRQCIQLPDIDHGIKFHVSGRVVDEISKTEQSCTNMPDTSCHYHCDEGYRLNGHPGLVCNPNGTWEGVVPECQIVDCSSLDFHHQQVLYGDVTYLNGTTTYGSKLRVVCQEGYRAFGDIVRTCTHHGTWSGTRAWCVENKCPALPLTPGLVITPVVCGQSALPPGSECLFECESGYILNGPASVSCTDKGAWNGSSETFCTDKQPPVIVCPDDLTTPITEANYALLHLRSSGARVTDNSNEYVVETVGFGDGPVRLTAGLHQFKYIARDKAGNEAQCFQSITVVESVLQVVTCPRNEIHIQTSQHQTEVVWPEVIFADHNNVTVAHGCVPANHSMLPPGQYNVQCVPTGHNIVQVTCQFTVRLFQPQCVVPKSPLHGSLSCSPTHASLLTCQVKCNDNYDFHSLPQSHYICDLNGVWNLKTPNVFWPDCTRKYVPNRALLRGQANYFYYRGNCENVKDLIAQKFRDHLQAQSWNICGKETCSVELVQITCGEDSKRKKRGVERRLRRESLESLRTNVTSVDKANQAFSKEEIVPKTMTNESLTNSSSEVVLRLFLLPENKLKKTTDKDEMTEEPYADRERTFGPGGVRQGDETSTRVFMLNKRDSPQDQGGAERGHDRVLSGDREAPGGDVGTADPDADVDMLDDLTQAGQLDDYDSTMSDLNPDNDTFGHDTSQSEGGQRVKITFQVIRKAPVGHEVTNNIQLEMIDTLHNFSDALTHGVSNLSRITLGNTTRAGGGGVATGGDVADQLIYEQLLLDHPMIEDCHDGYVSYEEIPGLTRSCAICPRGTYNDPTQNVCELCPEHQYQPDEGQLRCLQCPDDTFTPGKGAVNVSQCAVECDFGEYSLTGLAPCTPCPLHTFMPMRSASTCIPCPLKKMTMRPGANQLSECIDPCQPGKFSDTGLVPCQPCPKGSYVTDHGATKCFLCDEGESTLDVGSVNNSYCVAWDPCLENNTECLNNGSCRVTGNNTAACECPPGFTGAACEYNVDDCTESLCFNGATCVDGVNNFTCVCTPGHAGRYCEVGVDECLSSPCLNGGSCLDKVNDFECYCPMGYTGRQCNVTVEPCSADRCVHGACVKLAGLDVQCKCNPGFAGPSCNVTYDLCSAHPCLHAKECVSTPGSYTCLCLPGYTGKLCDVATDQCSLSPCYSGSTCISLTTGYLCKCPPGWAGELCSIAMSPDVDLLFNPDTIEGHYALIPEQFMPSLPAFTLSSWLRPLPLSAFSTIVTFVLTRQRQSTMADSEDRDYDVIFDVRHTDKLIVTFFEDSVTTNATLTPHVWTHLCITWSSVSGRWSVSINGSEVSSGGAAEPHRAIPAQVAVVIGQQNPYFAEAALLWNVYTGEITQFNIFGQVLSHDDIRLLANQSSCNQTFGDVVSWTDVIFHAEDGAIIVGNSRCLDVNECLFPHTFPCLKNRKCTDFVGGYNCSDCIEGYTGAHCSEPDNECLLDDKCFNGECVDGPDLFDYKCNCFPGYTGLTCSARIDECASNPCQNGGTCSMTDDSFTCQCPDRNMGPLCERPSSLCLSDFCMNNGTCIEYSSGGYTCQCREHFTGLLCDRRMTWCEENPCLNGAACVNTSSRNTTGTGLSASFHCQCLNGWTGKVCGVRQEPTCDLSPCVDGGTCIPAPGTDDGYVCRCRHRQGVSLDKNCAVVNPCESSPCPGTHVCVSDAGTYQCSCLKPGCDPWPVVTHDNSTPDFNSTSYNRMNPKRQYWWASDLAFALISGVTVCLVAILVVTVYLCRRKKTNSLDLEVLDPAADVALGHMTNPGFQNDEGTAHEESTYAELSDDYSVPDRSSGAYADDDYKLSIFGSSSALGATPAYRTSTGSSSGSARSSLSRKLQRPDEISKPLLMDDYLEPVALKRGLAGVAPAFATPDVKDDVSGRDVGFINAGFNPEDYLIPNRVGPHPSALVSSDSGINHLTGAGDPRSPFVMPDAPTGLTPSDYVAMDQEKTNGTKSVSPGYIKSANRDKGKHRNIYVNMNSSPSTNSKTIAQSVANTSYGQYGRPNANSGQLQVPVPGNYLNAHQLDPSPPNKNYPTIKTPQEQEKVTLANSSAGNSATSSETYIPFLDVANEVDPPGQSDRQSSVLKDNISEANSVEENMAIGKAELPSLVTPTPMSSQTSHLDPTFTSPAVPSDHNKMSATDHRPPDEIILEDYTGKSKPAKQEKTTPKSKTVLNDFSVRKNRSKKNNPLFLNLDKSKSGGSPVSDETPMRNGHPKTASSNMDNSNGGEMQPNKNNNRKRSLPPLPL
ncbi:hypothetical protein Btru_077859 [Bulinus truncatus]|nr:hypothetical protein Btru_077859 [Bulinus truncatus]